MSVCDELNMPGHFISKRKSLVPARNLTQVRPTHSLVTMSTTLPKFSVLIFMLCNAWVIYPSTENPEFWQLQAQLEYTLPQSGISAVIKSQIDSWGLYCT
jgi:hypothetical protein